MADRPDEGAFTADSEALRAARFAGPAHAVADADPLQLFVSYSHVNAAWFAKLRPLLKFETRTELAYAWHDQELKAGDRWDTEIKAALDKMDVFVCLLSFEFLASGYITSVELKRDLAREKKKEVEIVPIVLYPMDLKKDCPKLYPFNPLPGDKSWRDYERDGGHYQDAHKSIRDGLRHAIEKAKSKRKSP